MGKPARSGREKTVRQAQGAHAEDRALRHLQERGLTLVERNFRCRLGEVDLIMREDDTLVFVEVRQRRSTRYGGAAASIDSAKQAKIIRAAQAYLLRFVHWPPCRFDVVTFDGVAAEWIKGAFEAA